MIGSCWSISADYAFGVRNTVLQVALKVELYAPLRDKCNKIRNRKVFPTATDCGPADLKRLVSVLSPLNSAE